MEEEAHQIKDYFHDEAVAFAGAMNPKGSLAHNSDEMYSSDRYKLESWNPKDTIPVATFFMKRSPQKKHIFMSHLLQKNNGKSLIWKFIHSFLSGGIKNGVTGKKIPEYCCSVISEKPQPALYKEAANWMLKRITTKGSGFAEVDYFIKGKLEILI
ncbi:hypothetical protein [Prochlorococcus marinus]|uniref:hypothetical protein n=1 Tax=Prochlorococcus TaxID=1218 RepID=UPI00051679DD|nr:hypothetical protein [Prochlorococcus marinus]